MKAWNTTTAEDFVSVSAEPEETGHARVFKSSKTRKLMLRVYLWEIYEQSFLSNEINPSRKLDKARERLAAVLEGQRYAQNKIDIVFPENIEFWETLVANLREFEAEIGVPPQLAMVEASLPKTKRKIEVFTSTDRMLETTVDCFTDPFTEASQLMVEHELPSDEIDFIQGMIQHEMVDLVRGAVTEQREKLKTVQHKIAIVEHLLLLSETICGKYQRMKAVYESSTKKKKGEESKEAGDNSAANSTNRTVVHFNKLIIDERRKLEVLEKKIALEVKKAGRLEPHEMFRGDEDTHPLMAAASASAAHTPVKSSSNGIAMSTPNVKPFGGGGGSGGFGGASGGMKKGPRRASVSLRQALAVETPPAGKSFKPFSNRGITSLREVDEEDEDVEEPPFQPPDAEDEDNTFGLSQQEKDRKELFKKSEADRLQLISENRRLRGQVNEVGTRQLERMMEDLDPDLHSIVSELNLWDCERDELDAQIDRLTDQKEMLLQRLVTTSRGKQMKASGSLLFIEDDDESD